MIQRQKNSLNKRQQDSWVSICKRIKFNSDFTLYIKIISNASETCTQGIKLLEKSGVNLYNLGFENNFLPITPKVEVNKENTDTLNFTFCAQEHHQ